MVSSEKFRTKWTRPRGRSLAVGGRCGEYLQNDKMCPQAFTAMRPSRSPVSSSWTWILGGSCCLTAVTVGWTIWMQATAKKKERELMQQVSMHGIYKRYGACLQTSALSGSSRNDVGPL